MVRSMLSGLFVLGTTLLASGTARAAEAADFVGTFENDVEGMKEVWTIRMQNNRWAVSGVYLKDDKQIGNFAGLNPMFRNGDLTFVLKFGQKPKPGWIDNSGITVKMDGGKFTYTWQAGGSSGTRNLAKAEAAEGKDGSEIVGSWKGPIDGFEEIWTIKKEKDEFTVTGIYLKDGQEEGSFHGEKPKYVNGVLTITHVFDKQPVGTPWINRSTMTLKSTGKDKVSYTWRVLGSTGTRNMTRVDADVKPPATGTKPGDGGELVGTWNGEVDGLKEAWTIKNEDGKWSVTGVYTRNNKRAGSYKGVDVKFDNGKLTFTQKFEKMPDGVVWIDGAKITIKPDGDKIAYTWEALGSSGTRKMSK